MKKLIAILAVFAVLAGAAFAQDEGSWSIGGSGRIDNTYNFINNRTTLSGDTKGSLDATYTRGIVKGIIGFSSSGNITGAVEVAGEGFNFQAKVNNLFGTVAMSKLWGNFTIGDFLFQGAVADKDPGDMWAVLGDEILTKEITNSLKNHLLVNYAADGLEVGLFLPNVYFNNAFSANVNNTIAGVKFAADPITLSFRYSYGTPLNKEASGFNFLRFQGKFVINSAMWAGVDFAAVVHPIFKGNAGATFKYDEKPISASVKFVAGFAEGQDDVTIGLNANVKYTYEADPLTAWFELAYGTGDIANNAGTLNIKPGLTYDITADTLRFKLETDFAIPFKDGVNMTYEIKPQLTYNFLGNGVSDGYGDLKTALNIAYTFKGDTDGILTNQLFTGLRWSF